MHSLASQLSAALGVKVRPVQKIGLQNAELRVRRWTSRVIVSRVRWEL